MKYLKKRKVHEMAAQLLPEYELPMCLDCSYKSHGGYEWLFFTSDTGYVTFTVAYLGKWIRVYEKSFDDEVLRNEVLTPIKFAKEVTI